MIRKFFFFLLVEYANDRLVFFKKWLVAIWLKGNSSAREDLKSIQLLQKAMGNKPIAAPSKELWKRIESKIISAPVRSDQRGIPHKFWSVWAGGMALIILSLVLLWYVLPPGITLQWSTVATEPKMFRIYRGNVDVTDSFKLLDEIPPGSNITSLDARVYTYRDIFLLPGQEYMYRIEMIDQNGLVSSQTILSHAMDAVPGQVALLLALIIFFYGLSLGLLRTKFLRFSEAFVQPFVD